MYKNIDRHLELTSHAGLAMPFCAVKPFGQTGRMYGAITNWLVIRRIVPKKM